MEHPKLTLAAQAIAAALLLFAAIQKLVGDPATIEVFMRLDMEPGGRYMIAVVELAAAFLLLSPLAALGSVLAVAVMCGALIAHLTQLGLLVPGHYLMVGMLFAVLLSASYVLISRRKEIPIIGSTLD